MKIKWGAMVTDGSGSLGGHTFTKNLGGSIIRTKVVPTNPNTPAQAAVRSLFGALSSQWSALSSSARLAWNGAVDSWQTTNVFGDLKKPTGKALFQRLNNQAQSAGLGAIALPPARLEMPSEIVSDATIAVGAGTLTLTGANTDASTQIVVSASATLSDGTSSMSNRDRVIYAVAADSFVAVDAYAAYVAKFGAPVAGANIFIAVKYVLATGQVSPKMVRNDAVDA